MSIHAANGPHVDLAIAQNTAGTGSGSGCANARAVSFLNAAANWGPGKAIAPGTVVGLCGTITSGVVVPGSGAPGKPVTLLFMRGAKLSEPACDPCVAMNRQSYVTVDGGSNGVIENTNNGTHLGLHTPSTAISALACNHCVIKHLTIQNIYVHDGSGDNIEVDQTLVRAINMNGSNDEILGNVIHDVGWAIVFGDNGDHDVRIASNDISHADHGIVPSFGTAGGSTGPYFIAGNHLHDFANWDTASNTYHHDGIHCYTIAGGRPIHISDLYIYNNTFDGDIGENETAWIFVEGGTGPDSTPCADATSKIWFFNNVLKLTRDSNNGAAAFFTSRVFSFDNTLIGHGTSGGSVYQQGDSYDGPGMFQGNVVTTGNNLISAGRSVLTGAAIDWNVYANAGMNGNGWYCGGDRAGFVGSLRQWQSCIRGDAHSIYVRDAKLNSVGIPAPGSPVLGAGANLANLCKGALVPLCSDHRGALRPIRMRPDAGAFQAETAEITGGSIGQARVGAAHAVVEHVYGRRPLVSRRTLIGGITIRSVRVSTYQRHGGQLLVGYAGGKAALVMTTSRYYSTRAGFGVGAETSPNALSSSGWRPCGRGYLRARGDHETAVVLRGTSIVAVTVAARGILRCP